MLDIKFIRENPDAVKENIKKKFQDAKLPLVDEVIALDSERREAINEGDVVAINFDTGVITDETTGQTFQARPEPAHSQKILSPHKQSSVMGQLKNAPPRGQRMGGRQAFI